MNTYTFDTYVMACVKVQAETEADAREKLSRIESFDPHPSHWVLPDGMEITELSYRKVHSLPYAEDANLDDLKVSVLDTDGPVAELEAPE